MMMKKLLTSFGMSLLASGMLAAQTIAPPPPPDAAGPPSTVVAEAPVPPPLPGAPAQVSTNGPRVWVARGQERGIFVTARGPGMGMRGPGPGMWWTNPGLVKRLGLADDQVAKIKKIFFDQRLQLIDLHANLEKQEVILQPMIDADHPDESAVLAQIDKVAEARASLEKSNARMLFAVRDTLTPEQWQKLRQIRVNRAFQRPVVRGMMRRQEGGRAGRVMMRRGGGSTSGPQTPPAPAPPATQGNGSSQQP